MVALRITKAQKIVFVVLCTISAVGIYLLYNPHVPAKLIFSFNEDYQKTQLNGVDVLINSDIVIEEDKVVRGMEQTKERAAKLFDVANEDKVDIFVALPGDRIYDMYLGKGNLGIYHPPIKTVAVDGQYTGDLSSTIIHEYSHHLFYEYIDTLKVTSEQIPEWLEEGLALTFEYELMNNVLVKYGPMFNAIPFKQLEEIRDVNSHTIYLQGFYGIMFLLEKYGDSIIRQLIEGTVNSSFHVAWAKLIEEPYETFHDNFEIQQGSIRKLESLQGDHLKVIAYVDSVKEEHGRLNVYTPFTSLALIEAYAGIGELEKAKITFDMYEPFINNPAEFADLAIMFKGDPSFNEMLMNKGLNYALQYGYDTKEYEAYLQSVQ